MGAEVDPSAMRPGPRSTSNAGLPPELVGRLRFIRGVILGSLLVTVAGLGYWQIGRSAEYTAIERRQNLRRVMLPGPRGIIYDRNHRVLAGNRTRVAAVLHLASQQEAFLREKETLLNQGPDILTSAPEGTARAEARARFAVVQRHLDRINLVLGHRIPLDALRLERAFARARHAPFVLVDGLNETEGARLEASLHPADPVKLQRVTERWYPHGHAAAHVLGRLRREVVRTPVGKDFPILNYIGTVGDFGVEQHHDARLQGRLGEAVIRVDAFGSPADLPLERREPAPGQDLVLSLDLDLQRAAERAMAATPGRRRGAAVALAVATGEVLVLASQPDFDLNTISPVLTAASKEAIDEEGGWFNRATQGLYPPGSSFKIFTALAGLRRGTLQPGLAYQCAGFYEVAGHRFVCHQPAGHGAVALSTALAHSCNVFAYQTGLAAGPDALADEARRFHFHQMTGIDLPFETSRMLVPDPAWKEAVGAGRWTRGDTVNLAIGQGALRISPLQAACAIASLARRETLTVPTLIRQPGRRPAGDRAPEPLGLTDGDYAALVASMRAVIETGIGREAQVPGESVAGKTGTAQVLRPEGMMNVAWFVAFAPVERPEIAVAVAIEGEQPGVEFAGAEHAAPIVREIIGTYFDPRARPL